MLSTLAPPSYGNLARLGIARDANTSYEEHEDYDPLVDGISRRKTEKTHWNSPTTGHNGLREKYRQQIENLTSRGQRGVRTEKSNAEVFVSSGPNADVKETRCRRVAQAKSADGQWSFSSSSTSTSTYVVTKGFGNGLITGGRRSFSLGPKITEMELTSELDLNTIASTTNLDHSHQKVRSELAQKGSLGHRRPPTRAGLKSFVSSVWDQPLEERSNSGSSDLNHNETNSHREPIRIQEHVADDSDASTKSKETSYVVEVSDSQEDIGHSQTVRDDPEGREDLIRNEADLIDVTEPDDDVTRWNPPKHAVLVFPMQLLNNSPLAKNKSPKHQVDATEPWSGSRVNEGVGEDHETIRSEKTTVHITSESPSSSDTEEDSAPVDRRCSAPTVVSITLKDPLGARVKSVEDLLSPDIHKVNSPTVIPFGQFRKAQSRESLLGPTQIMIRPFNSEFGVDKVEPSQDRDSTFITESNRRLHREEKIIEEQHVVSSRSAGVQVHIGTKKMAPSLVAPRKYPRDGGSPSPERKEETRNRKNGTTLPPGVSITSTPSKARTAPARSNTVVFIKPNHPPPPPPASQSNHISRSVSTRETRLQAKLESSREARAIEDNDNNVKDRLSVSSLDLSTKSNDSSKEGSIPPNKPSRKDPNLRQRVQIQTWDRRSQTSTSPSPSRSKIRELVMSPKPSSTRPASVIGDGGESERLTVRKVTRSEDEEVSSRRSSPTGHKFSPNLNLSGSKPDWLKKIDLDRRKVIDWDNLGRRVSEESVSLQNWASERCLIDKECNSLDGTERVRKDTPIPGACEVTARGPKTSLPGFSRLAARTSDCSIKEEEPEWIRIAEKKRNSAINWDEITGYRLEKPEPEVESCEAAEDEAHVVHNILTKVRASRRENSPDLTTGQERGRASGKEVSRRRSQSTGYLKFPWVDDKKVIIEELPTSSKKSGRNSPRLVDRVGDGKTDRANRGGLDRADRVGLDRADRVGLDRANRVGLERVDKMDRADNVGLDRVEKTDRADRFGLDRANRVGFERVDKMDRADNVGLDRAEKTDRADRFGLDRADKMNRVDRVKSDRADRVRTDRDDRVGSDRTEKMNRVDGFGSDRANKMDRATKTDRVDRVKLDRADKSDRVDRPRTERRIPIDVESARSKSPPQSTKSRNPVDSHRQRHTTRRDSRRSASYDRNLHPLTSTSGSDQDDRTDSTSDSPGKKKVRFLISNREAKPEKESGKTYMFGADANNDGAETAGHDGMDADDYQLQAYKIINRIKSMSKSRTPSPNRNATAQRSHSLQRSSSGDSTPPRVPVATSTSRQSRKSRTSDAGNLTRSGSSGRDSLPRSSRKASTNSGAPRGTRRPESPSASENKRREPKRSESTRANTKSPDWMNKVLHKKNQNGVDWESLEKPKQTDSVRSKDKNSKIPVKKYFFNASINPRQSS